jgi:uncharacterized protein YdeI (YjbR/CyaY-like superfamily)
MIENKVDYDTLFVTERSEWRNWLNINHQTTKEIWLVNYNEKTGKKRIAINDAVEEAICFGWIDSIVKKVDDDIYIHKFLPRKENSLWTFTDKRRAEEMISRRKMTDSGMKKVEEAIENGNWNKPIGFEEIQVIPKDVLKALSENETALKNFKNFAPSLQHSYIYRINNAKKIETRKRRIKKTC